MIRVNQTVKFAPYIVLAIGGIILGRLILMVNNPWAIFLACLAVAVGVALYLGRGPRALLVMQAWLLWYPLYVQPFAALAGPLTRGATLSEIAFLVFGAFSAVRTITRRDKAVLGLTPIICLVVTSVGWALTMIAAPPSQTFPGFRHLLYLLVLAGLCAQYVRSPAQAWPVIWGVVLSTLVRSGLIFWGQYLHGLPFYDAGVNVLQQDTSRLHGLYTLPGTLPVEVWGSRESGLLAAVSLILLLRAAFGQAGWGRRIAWILIIPSGALLFSTGGRAGWVGLMLGLGVVLFISLFHDRPHAGRLLAFLAVIGGLCLGIYAVTVMMGEDAWQRVTSLAAFAQDPSWVTRLNFSRLVLSQLSMHPFGIGFDTLLLNYGVFEHNTYLVLANGVGPIGLGALCVLWIWIAKRSIRIVRGGLQDEVPVGVLSLAVLTAVLVAGVAENTPFLSEGPWMVWGVAAGVASRYASQGSERV